MNYALFPETKARRSVTRAAAGVVHSTWSKVLQLLCCCIVAASHTTTQVLQNTQALTSAFEAAVIAISLYHASGGCCMASAHCLHAHITSAVSWSFIDLVDAVAWVSGRDIGAARHNGLALTAVVSTVMSSRMLFSIAAQLRQAHHIPRPPVLTPVACPVQGVLCVPLGLSYSVCAV